MNTNDSRIISLTTSTGKAKELGCQDPPLIPGGGFLGTGFITEMQDADKKQRFPDFLYDREVQMSQIHGRECSTFKQYLLGQEIYFTSAFLCKTARHGSIDDQC